MLTTRPICMPSGVFRGGHGAMPLFGSTMKIFYRRLYMKKCVFAVFQQELKIQQCLTVFFSYRYNMRLKLPCEIVSDMTLWLSAFPNFRKNGQICGFHWTFKRKKCFSFSGASPPNSPTRGSAPGPRWELRPQTPIIGSRSASSPWSPCQILNTPLCVAINWKQ